LNKGLQQRLQRLRGDRLHQVLVEAGRDGAQPILLLPPTGDGYQYRATSPGSGADLPGELVAVDVRKPDVQQQGVRTEGSRQLERLPSGVCRLDVMPGRFEQHGASVCGIAVVIHHQDLEADVRCRRLSVQLNIEAHRQRRSCREHHGELASPADALAPGLYASAVEHDEAPHQRQTYTQSAFGAPERLV